MRTIYNYEHFGPSLYELVGEVGAAIGERVPEVEVFDPQGNDLRLGDLLRDGPLVLETASYTCPQYVHRMERMNRLARSHPDHRFVVLYVREAHPGERLGPHTSLDDKRLAAIRVRDDGESRQMLIDDLDGTLHRALGGLPNMVYVIGQDGTIRFKSHWANPKALERFLAGTDGDPPARSERGFRPVTPTTLFPVLLRGGRRAVKEFLLALPQLIVSHLRAVTRNTT